MELRTLDKVFTISIILVLLGFSYTILVSNEMTNLFEIIYIPILPTIIIMFTLCDLGYQLPILMSVIYISVFVALINIRISYGLFNVTRNDNTDKLPFLLRLNNIPFDMTNDYYLFLIIPGTMLCLTLLVSLYLKVFNDVLLKSIYKQLLSIDNLTKKMKSIGSDEIRWLECVMPRSIVDDIVSKNVHLDQKNSMIFQHYDNVGILSCSILGIEELVHNTNTYEFLQLFSDLYDSFELVAKNLSCDRLGFMGTNFRYITGGPVFNYEISHSLLSMSQGIVQAVDSFNLQNRKEIHYKIGLHIGKVNLAVVGCHRFRYDVYSHDCVLVDALKKSSTIDRIRLTEIVKKTSNELQQFEDAPNINAKLEVVYGIAGCKLSNVDVKTFFIKILEMNKMLPTKTETLSKLPLDWQVSTLNSSMNSEILEDENVSLKPSPMSVFIFDEVPEQEKEIGFIQSLRVNSENIMRFIWSPPLTKILLRFEDPEMEWQFENQVNESNLPFLRNSIKFSITFDTIANILFTLVFIVMLMLFLKFSILQIFLIFSLFAMGSMTTFLLSINSYTNLNTGLTNVYANMGRTLIILFVSTLPSIIIFSVLILERVRNTRNDIFLNILIIFSFVSHILHTGIQSVFRIVVSILMAVIFISFIVVDLNISSRLTGNGSQCSDYSYHLNGIFNMRLVAEVIPQLIVMVFIVTYVTRSSECNIRLQFLISRESRIITEQLKIYENYIKELILNILPKFALESGGGVMKLRTQHLRYVQNTRKTGILLVRFNNFYASFYDETYKDGEGAIRLLHSLIVEFDTLLNNADQYQDFVKMSSVGVHYLVLSGINPLSNHQTCLENSAEEKNNSKLLSNPVYMQLLIEFAFLLISRTERFNKQFVVGKMGMHITVGVFTGNVITAVLTNKRPCLCAWGSAINTTYRLCEMGKPGENSVVTTGEFCSSLKDTFNFKLHPINEEQQIRRTIISANQPNKDFNKVFIVEKKV